MKQRTWNSHSPLGTARSRQRQHKSVLPKVSETLKAKHIFGIQYATAARALIVSFSVVCACRAFNLLCQSAFFVRLCIDAERLTE